MDRDFIIRQDKSRTSLGALFRRRDFGEEASGPEILRAMKNAYIRIGEYPIDFGDVVSYPSDSEPAEYYLVKGALRTEPPIEVNLAYENMSGEITLRAYQDKRYESLMENELAFVAENIVRMIGYDVESVPRGHKLVRSLNIFRTKSPRKNP